MINQLKTEATKLTSPENFKKGTDRVGNAAERSTSQLKETSRTVTTKVNTTATSKMEDARRNYDGKIEMIDIRDELLKFGKETNTENKTETDTENNFLGDLGADYSKLNQFDLGEISGMIEKLQEGLLNGDIDQEGIFLLQSLLQQQMQLISTISNVQKQQHDAQMAVINNIR